MQTHEAYYVVRESRIIHVVGVLPVISEARKEYVAKQPNFLFLESMQMFAVCTCTLLYHPVCCLYSFLCILTQ